ncbi:MAG: CPBP family intramembrane metalloprotease, partial [Candidatus Hydrogenedentes bacterium]|nr:CPBP family intramembrane metalloprotease [Candidatus Hydrogenedentota bacterium]
WEFLHRYFLVRPFSARWPRYGWLVVPVSEGAYHLQKHWTEMILMVAFSVALTWWTVRRKNALLPFLAHLFVEVELIAFMVLV